MANRLLLTALLLTLGLCAVVQAQGTAVADAPVAAAPAAPSWTPADLAALIGSDVPKTLAALPDLNPEDKFAVGVDVFSGPIMLQVGNEALPATLQVYTREFNVGAVRVMTTGGATRPRAAYMALRSALLGSSVAPAGTPALGATASNWGFADAGTVRVMRGTGGGGLGFSIVTTGMAASYDEFWRNWQQPAAVAQ
jgi:hypothetical protein